ncbi:hypothetical protein GOC35_10070 [Sinorhizobium meliloti]|nr:hypothetical protein [Sinorhizobium meliloti]MDX0212030.1 hypothetical protein [Sinorhizobium meliloti]
MLTVDVFRGDAAEAAAFTTDAWRAAYAGRGFHPEWSAEYIARQLMDLPDLDRVHCLGAYDRNRLIGFFAAEEMDFRTPAGVVRGTMSSWLSVAPDCGIPGVGTAMQKAMWDWQISRNTAFMIGFVNAGLVRGKGRSFWLSRVPEASIFRRPAIWAHILRPQVAAQAHPTRLEGFGVRVLSRLQRKPMLIRDVEIRDYRPEDINACRALFDQLEAVPFGYSWTPERLAHQLASRDGNRTFVLVGSGGVEGFAAVSRLNLTCRGTVRCAVLDFFSVRAAAQERAVNFLRTCLASLAPDFDAVLALGPPVHEATLLRRGGLLPMPPSQAMIFLPIDKDTLPPSPKSRILVHWR